MTRFGENNTTSVAVTQSQTAIVPPRPQPKGLKARYLPMGVAATHSDNEDTPMTEASASTAKSTTATPKAKGEKKRKHATTGDGSSQQEKADSSKKVKKARVAEPTHSASKITPILPPAIPDFSSSMTAPAATPSKVPVPPMVPASTSKASRAGVQSASFRKETPVPAPSSPDMTAATPAADKKKSSKSKKAKSSEAKESSASVKGPRKETPILPPPTPGNGSKA